MTTSLDAFVTCWGQQPDGSVLPLALEGGREGKRVPSSQPQALQLVAADAGRQQIGCIATENAVDAAVPAGAVLADLRSRAGQQAGLLAADQLTVQVTP